MVVRGLARRLDGIVRNNNNNNSNMSNGNNNNNIPPHPPVLVYDRHETNLIIDGTIVDSTTLAHALRSTGTGTTGDDHGGFQIGDIDKFKTLTIRNISRVDQGVVDGMRKIIQRTISSTAAPTKAATTTAEKATAKTTTATSSLKPPPPPAAAPPPLPLPSSSSNEIYDIYSVYGPPPPPLAAAAAAASNETYDIYSAYGPPPPLVPLPPPVAASSSSSNSENNNVKNCENDNDCTEEECKHKKKEEEKKNNNDETDDNKRKKWEKIELIHSSGPCISKLIEEVLPYTDGFAYTGSVPLHRTRYNLDDNCLTAIGNVLMASNDTDHEEEIGTGSGGSSSSSSGTTAASVAASADTKKDRAEEAEASPSPSPTISFLSLKGTRLRGNGFEVLCRGLGSSTSLKRFELSNCSLEAEDVGKLASALRQNKYLTYLGFAGCKFGSTISHIARRPSLSSAAEDHRQEEVQQEAEAGDVAPHNGLDQGQRQRQAGGVLHAAARHPRAAGGGVNDGGEMNIDIQIDIGDDRSSDAESIVLSTNNTNPQTHFSQVLESLAGINTLETLKISSMYTNEASMNAIGSLLSSPNSALKILGLKNNLPQHDGSIHVGPLLEALKHNKKLINLQLSGNNINDEVVDQLTTILAGPNKTLQGLVLSSNSIGNDGVRSFARRLPDFKSLKSLDLQRNGNLDDDSKKALFAALEKNAVMLRLDLDNGADPKKIWWLTLNKAGRALLTKDQDIPPGLWPKILHRALTMTLGRVNRITNLDVMHYFLRRGHEMFEHAVDEDDHNNNKKDEQEQSPVIDHSQKKRKIDSIVNTSNTDNGNDDGDNEPPNEKKPRAT